MAAKKTPSVRATAAAKSPAAKKTAAGKAARRASPTAAASSDSTSSSDRPNLGKELRVRMYRIGFGDFFLVTVPTDDGPKYILIDCGVHAGNIGSMSDCVKNMAELTKGKLALVIVTHNHADHLSGFATEAEQFAEFEVDTVWITNRLAPENKTAMKVKKQVGALASHLSLQLAGRSDWVGQQALTMVNNALGVAGGSNDEALKTVLTRFKGKRDIKYYEAGQDPVLPKSLQTVLKARILGPAPIDQASEFTASDNKAAQYFSALEERGYPEDAKVQPFDRHWPASAQDYGDAYKPWVSPEAMEKALQALRPDVLAAAAATIDGTLNNQSLVVLFTCQKKNLLFVGDAQWGNWAHWLYGKAVKGGDPGISAEAQKILGAIDFYKVGHHGSTNATPIPAVSALRKDCVAMCSTQMRCYGCVDRNTEVPRIALMEALEERTDKRLVRSDWIGAGKAKFEPEARAQLGKLPSNFMTAETYIEYIF